MKVAEGSAQKVKVAWRMDDAEFISVLAEVEAQRKKGTTSRAVRGNINKTQERKNKNNKQTQQKKRKDKKQRPKPRPTKQRTRKRGLGTLIFLEVESQ